MPLSWDEVKPGLTMRHFTIHNSLQRLKETGDLFKGVLGEGISLESTIKKAQSVLVDSQSRFLLVWLHQLKMNGAQ
jgi:bifunctional non-homologous end joining protein LigD